MLTRLYFSIRCDLQAMIGLIGAKTFDVLLLRENISTGQRVEKFTLEYLDGVEWKRVTEGTTTGYKRM